MTGRAAGTLLLTRLKLFWRAPVACLAQEVRVRFPAVAFLLLRASPPPAASGDSLNPRTQLLDLGLQAQPVFSLTPL